MLQQCWRGDLTKQKRTEETVFKIRKIWLLLFVSMALEEMYYYIQCVLYTGQNSCFICIFMFIFV